MAPRKSSRARKAPEKFEAGPAGGAKMEKDMQSKDSGKTFYMKKAREELESELANNLQDVENAGLQCAVLKGLAGGKKITLSKGGTSASAVYKHKKTEELVRDGLDKLLSPDCSSGTEEAIREEHGPSPTSVSDFGGFESAVPCSVGTERGALTTIDEMCAGTDDDTSAAATNDNHEMRTEATKNDDDFACIDAAYDDESVG